MTRFPIIVLALATAASGVAGFATSPGRPAWSHVGNTANSAIFVDRALLAERGPQRRFRTLHVNTQPAAGWRLAEHHATIDCVAATVRQGDIKTTRTGGKVDAGSSVMNRALPFPKRGVMHTLVTSLCAGKLGPAIGDPQRWTRENFRPG